MRNLFIAALSLILMTSCFGGTTYSIDNPTDQPIEVSIDGKDPITVAAKELKRVDGTLSEGEHTMKVGDGQEIKFNLDRNHVVLNPTLSKYIVAEVVYGNMEFPTDTVITVDGVEYSGAFPLVSNAPFIYTGDLNFHIDQPVKDEIETSKGAVVYKKMLRECDFKDFYKKEYR